MLATLPPLRGKALQHLHRSFNLPSCQQDLWQQIVLSPGPLTHQPKFLPICDYLWSPPPPEKCGLPYFSIFLMTYKIKLYFPGQLWVYCQEQNQAAIQLRYTCLQLTALIDLKPFHSGTNPWHFPKNEFLISRKKYLFLSSIGHELTDFKIIYFSDHWLAVCSPLKLRCLRTKLAKWNISLNFLTPDIYMCNIVTSRDIFINSTALVTLCRSLQLL